MKNLMKIGMLGLCSLGFFNATAQTELTFYTTKGNIVIALTDSLTPRTVDSFISRVSSKFYDGLLFHRVINNFMIQGGDPLGNGMGGPGYSTPDEFHPTLKNTPGALAMANSGPNTNGSQFYINLVNNSSLDNHYTVLGMTTSGFPVVQAIGAVPTNSSDRPLTDVKMDSVRITKFKAGVAVFSNGSKASIYPNPSNGVFTIELPNVSSKVEIVSTSGQTVYTGEGKRNLKVDIHNQPAGLYYVHITNKDGSVQARLIVQ